MTTLILTNFDTDYEEQNTTPPSVPELNFEQDPLYNFPQPGPTNCSTPTSSSYTSNMSGSEGQELMAMMRHVLSGQEKLSLQVTEVQERIATVECCLDEIREDSSRKEDTTTSRRVNPQLTVSPSAHVLLCSHFESAILSPQSRKVLVCCIPHLWMRKSLRPMKGKLLARQLKILCLHSLHVIHGGFAQYMQAIFSAQHDCQEEHPG